MSDPSPVRLDHFNPHNQPKRSIRMLWILLALFVVLILLAVQMILDVRRPTETDNVVNCARNLRQIGQAILLYSNDYQGQYPDTLGRLLLTENLDANVFICPSGNNAASAAATKLAQAAEIDAGKHVDYLYVGRGLTSQTVTAYTVICYEPPANHTGIYRTGTNVLFGDGHVDFIDAKAAAVIYKQAAAGTWPVRYPLVSSATQSTVATRPAK